jgi:hypothetical protein
MEETTVKLLLRPPEKNLLNSRKTPSLNCLKSRGENFTLPNTS